MGCGTGPSGSNGKKAGVGLSTWAAALLGGSGEEELAPLCPAIRPFLPHGHPCLCLPAFLARFWQRMVCTPSLLPPAASQGPHPRGRLCGTPCHVDPFSLWSPSAGSPPAPGGSLRCCPLGICLPRVLVLLAPCLSRWVHAASSSLLPSVLGPQVQPLVPASPLASILLLSRTVPTGSPDSMWELRPGVPWLHFSRQSCRSSTHMDPESLSPHSVTLSEHGIPQPRPSILPAGEGEGPGSRMWHRIPWVSCALNHLAPEIPYYLVGSAHGPMALSSGSC